MALDLGFIDDSAKLLESRFFPSKVGGKPAWLDLKEIPWIKELVCATCNSRMNFLCQLYCPNDDKETAFHRTIYIFLCISRDCFHPNSNTNFVVLRNQLPKQNPFYPDTPPVEDLNWRPDITPSKFGTQLCTHCGMRNENESGEDGAGCSCSLGCDKRSSGSNNLIPEYGLCIEPANESGYETSSDESDDEEKVMPVNTKNFDTQFAQLSQVGSAQDDPTVELFFSKCSESVRDKVFAHFKTCVEADPDQVIRYTRDGEPLWISKEHIPTENDIPACEYCGKRRIFEFQILPQLLNYLNFDQGIDHAASSPDWGILAVYTCEDSCDVGPAYKKEFLWKQDVVK